MGTAVLRSQDCLRSPQRPKLPRPPRSSPPSSRIFANSPSPRVVAKGSPSPAKPYRNCAVQGRGGGRKTRSAAEDAGMVVRHTGRNLVMGEVTILKRGDEMKPDLPLAPQIAPTFAAAADEDDVFSSTSRLGPDPDILPKQIHLAVDYHKDVYAGSGFIASPSPSSVPLPSFFAKKDLVVDKADLATKALRYLLRLDLP